MKWYYANAGEIKKFSVEQFPNLILFDGEAFYGRLLCFTRGQVVPYHRHEHTDECFDVVEGEGTFLIDGREMRGVSGSILFVPAGIEHGMRADGSTHWIVRETVSERVYARRALVMVMRAIIKRIPIFGTIFRRNIIK